MFIKKELRDDLCIIRVDREESLNAMNPSVPVSYTHLTLPTKA